MRFTFVIVLSFLSLCLVTSTSIAQEAEQVTSFEEFLIKLDAESGVEKVMYVVDDLARRNEMPMQDFYTYLDFLKEKALTFSDNRYRFLYAFRLEQLARSLDAAYAEKEMGQDEEFEAKNNIENIIQTSVVSFFTASVILRQDIERCVDKTNARSVVDEWMPKPAIDLYEMYFAEYTPLTKEGLINLVFYQTENLVEREPAAWVCGGEIDSEVSQFRDFEEWKSDIKELDENFINNVMTLRPKSRE